MSSDLFADRPIGALSSGGQFCLWCLRKRVLCAKHGQSPHEVLGPGFQMAGIEEALHDFDALFAWLNAAATRSLYLGCPRCHRVSRDESLLLTALEASYRGERKGGERLLATILPPQAALSAAIHAYRFASALRRVDLPIALAKQPANARPAENGCATAQRACHAPGSTLVH